jgi:hypothetical protein
MKITQKTIRGISILALVLMLAACSTPTAVVQPTQDIPAVRTEAVQTVIARMTIEAALNPTATAAPTEPPAEPEATATTAPTNTVAAPTNTQAPAQPAATATSLPTVRPTELTGGGGGSVALPTATRRSGPDQAQLVSQEPGDGTVFNPGVEFDGAWTFKNIGTSTWTTDYDYRFARGTNYAEAASYSLPHEVKPGETVRLIADMAAPSEAGRTVSNWELVNENGEVFAQFYLVIDVK